MVVNLTILFMQLTQYVVGCVLFFGTIGSISNILIFSRKNLRHFPCSHYYLTQSVICLFLLYTAILLRYLADGYLIDLPSHSSFACKFFLYTSTIFRSLSALFILWSSIDRYLSSSSSEQLRRLSQVKYTAYIICLTILTIVALFIYVPIYFGDSSQSTSSCTSNGHGSLSFAHNLLNAFILAIFVPFMLILFSIMTFKNVQRRRLLVHTTNTVAQQRQNTHMIRLMLSQSFNYLILVAPNAILNLYTVFVPPQTAQLLFTYKLLFLIQYVHPATAFYINTLVSRTYRLEGIKILDNVVKRVFHSTVIERRMMQNNQIQQEQGQSLTLKTTVVREMEMIVRKNEKTGLNNKN